jgi:AcrR family transcriptional regulator
MDAVYDLLQDKSVRDLTMEAIAKRAGVGKPTLYKWWPSKAALVFAMFHERIANNTEPPVMATAEQAIRGRVQHLIREFNGLFGKVMADLVAEGQSEPEVLHELYEQHLNLRQKATMVDIERGKANGEFRADTNPQVLVDSIFGAIYFRLLLRYAPLTEQYGETLVSQVLQGIRVETDRSADR